MSAEDEIIQLLNESSSGSLTDNHIKIHFAERYLTDVVPAVNSLLRLNRIQLFTNSGGALVYKIIHEDIAVKFEGLGPEQIMVFQTIEKSGNRSKYIAITLKIYIRYDYKHIYTAYIRAF